ncbi:TetR/AcrR family transcriptional regulator [Rhizobium sp. BK377]|uniref:TetR/AcrR family transcriptional regulator n=1 Tax=Rhizobium sp. BK377 TaxID=2587058 RepID=UPI001609F9DF|nr:TetR/AcrR family transcriptional regulator [Rhizobium sp. BK377]MBB3459752.1 AcrR family transcriptional regulator [Rhizobium sp. BK377]
MTSRTPGRPRTKPAEERREDLMLVAERLFLEKGVDHTTIEEITQGAGVSKGAFYLHFSSKADVIEALRTRFVQKLLNGIVEELGKQQTDDWNGKLTAWAKACAMGYLNAARLHNLVFAAAPPPSREGLTNNILIDNLQQLLAAGSRERAWSLQEPAFTAIFLFNALHGVVNRNAIGDDSAKRTELLRNIEESVLRLVR